MFNAYRWNYNVMSYREAEKLGWVIQGFTETKEKICVMEMVSDRRPIWHAKSESFILAEEVLYSLSV